MWEYNSSVEKVRGIVLSWKTLTNELINELETARSILSKKGTRNDITSDQKIQSWSQYCKDIGSSRGVVNRWIKHKSIINTKNHISNNSEQNEWYTPNEISDRVIGVLKTIDLDPASSEAANNFIMAKHYYTKEDNGLTKDWYGNVWVNPPYSRKSVSKFADHIINQRGNFTQAIVLVNNATETNWLQSLIANCDCICLLNGRIKYLDENGDRSNAPLQGQVVLYFGEDISSFIKEFSNIGICMIRTE